MTPLVRPEKDIIWISSYPKSGNTWVRALVACVIWGEPKEGGDLWRRVPDLHNGVDFDAYAHQPVKFIKVHVMFNKYLPHHEKTLGSIYIVRHPLDVMLANMNFEFLFSGFNNGKRECSTFDGWNADAKKDHAVAFLENFINNKGFSYWEKFGIGNLGDNINSWVGASKTHPVLFLRYEDLKADVYTETQKIARFLGVSISNGDLEKAVEYASFKNMKRIEEKDIASGKKTFLSGYPGIDQGYRFLNKGIGGRYKTELTEEIKQKGFAAFAPICEMFGYNL